MKARRKLEAGKLAVGFPAKRDEAVLNASGLRSESVVFDFANDGGAVGNIAFGRNIPANAIIVRILSEELTAVTGATDIDFKAGSTALSSALDLTADAGIQSRALDGSVAGIKVSADSELNIDINTAAATAGKVRFFVEYLLPND